MTRPPSQSLAEEGCLVTGGGTGDAAVSGGIGGISHFCDSCSGGRRCRVRVAAVVAAESVASCHGKQKQLAAYECKKPKIQSTEESLKRKREGRKIKEKIKNRFKFNKLFYILFLILYIIYFKEKLNNFKMSIIFSKFN